VIDHSTVILVAYIPGGASAKSTVELYNNNNNNNNIADNVYGAVIMT